MDSETSKAILFLDDQRTRAEEFLKHYPKAVWVMSAADCIKALEKEWDEIWLDHDLGGEIFVDSGKEDCGMEVVRKIIEKKPQHLLKARFVIHSFNLTAAYKMAELLKQSGYHAERIPFPFKAPASILLEDDKS